MAKINELPKWGIDVGTPSTELPSTIEIPVALTTPGGTYDNPAGDPLTVAITLEQLAEMLSLAVYDESGVVGTNIRKLNFVGVDVEASIDPSDPRAVVVRIPAVAYPFFNTGTATVNAPSTINFYTPTPSDRGGALPVPAPTIGDWLPTQSAGTRPVVQGNTYSLVTAGKFQCASNTTEIKVTLMDWYDSGNPNASIVNHEVTMVLNGTVTTPPPIVNQDNIRIEAFDWDYNGGKPNTRLRVDVDLIHAIPQSGRFSIKIEHFNGAGTYTFESSDIYYDRDLPASDISGITLEYVPPATPGTDIVRISGVAAYNSSVTFKPKTVGAGVSYLCSDAYSDTVLEIDVDEPFGSIYVPPTSSGFASSIEVADTDSVPYEGSNITPNDFTAREGWYVYSSSDSLGEFTTMAKAYSRGLPVASVNEHKSTIFYTAREDMSTIATEEHFLGESRRVDVITPNTSTHNSTATVWDSSTFLSNGQLQVGPGCVLMYPSTNYTVYDVASETQPNYASISGQGTYTRLFTSANVRTNGIFEIIGLTEANLDNGDVKLEISIDGNEWYDLTVLYPSGVLADGVGCRVDKNNFSLDVNNKIKFTLGQDDGIFRGHTREVVFGSNTYPNGMYLRVTYNSGTPIKISSISIIDW